MEHDDDDDDDDNDDGDDDEELRNLMIKIRSETYIDTAAAADTDRYNISYDHDHYYDHDHADTYFEEPSQPSEVSAESFTDLMMFVSNEKKILEFAQDELIQFSQFND